MTLTKGLHSFKHLPLAIATMSLTMLVGCGSNSSSTTSSGYLNFYNVSANSPAIYFTIDEDLEEDEDDEVEITYPSVAFEDSSGIYDVDENEYFFELAWQDDDSSDRDDLTLIYESKIEITDDEVTFVVLSEDVATPNVLSYQIPIIDDEDDDTDNLFNLRVLNMHPYSEGIDVYISESDETFNEAELVGGYSYTELSDNQKFDQDEYVFYITKSGEEDVLYKSESISFPYSSQYVMSVRENLETEDATFVMDKVALTNITKYPDATASAEFKVFNSISDHECDHQHTVDLLANYTGAVDFYLDELTDTPAVSALENGSFSEELAVEKNDYNLILTIADSDEIILQNHILTLPENSNKTIFFYLNEEDVDHDGDGDVDEDGDGIVDEVEMKISSLAVNNSTSTSIYDHEIKMVNLIDDDDFSYVKFYFVRSDDLIETTPYSQTASFASSSSINLVNNTYKVYVIATDDGSEIMLTTQELILDEDTNELFLIIEEDESSVTGYTMTKLDQ